MPGDVLSIEGLGARLAAELREGDAEPAGYATGSEVGRRKEWTFTEATFL